MERTTLKDIEGVVDRFNSMVAPKYKVHVGQRYGHKAIDLYDSKGSLVDTLRSGMSSSEVTEYLWAMIKGIELYDKARASKKLEKVM